MPAGRSHQQKVQTFPRSKKGRAMPACFL